MDIFVFFPLEFLYRMYQRMYAARRTNENDWHSFLSPNIRTYMATPMCLCVSIYRSSLNPFVSHVQAAFVEADYNQFSPGKKGIY